jgi:antitoxin CcdA
MLSSSLSQTIKQRLAAAIAQARQTAWLRDNRAAIDAMNKYVETHGIPLEEY